MDNFKQHKYLLLGSVFIVTSAVSVYGLATRNIRHSREFGSFILSCYASNIVCLTVISILSIYKIAQKIMSIENNKNATKSDNSAPSLANDLYWIFDSCNIDNPYKLSNSTIKSGNSASPRLASYISSNDYFVEDIRYTEPTFLLFQIPRDDPYEYFIETKAPNPSIASNNIASLSDFQDDSLTQNGQQLDNDDGYGSKVGTHNNESKRDINVNTIMEHDDTYISDSSDDASSISDYESTEDYFQSSQNSFYSPTPVPRVSSEDKCDIDKKIWATSPCQDILTSSKEGGNTVDSSLVHEADKCKSPTSINCIKETSNTPSYYRAFPSCKS